MAQQQLNIMKMTFFVPNEDTKVPSLIHPLRAGSVAHKAHLLGGKQALAPLKALPLDNGAALLLFFWTN